MEAPRASAAPLSSHKPNLSAASETSTSRVNLSVSSSLCLSVHLSLPLWAFVSVSLCIYLCLCAFVYVSVHLSLSLCAFVCLSFSVRPYNHFSLSPCPLHWSTKIPSPQSFKRQYSPLENRSFLSRSLVVKALHVTLCCVQLLSTLSESLHFSRVGLSVLRKFSTFAQAGPISEEWLTSSSAPTSKSSCQPPNPISLPPWSHIHSWLPSRPGLGCVDQSGIKFTEIHMSLTPGCWD